MNEKILDSQFELQIVRQHWIKDDGKYDKTDLCSHGKLFLKIGDKILSDENSDSWSLSTAGLYLLRTLQHDYKIGDFGNYLIPCCGNFIIPHEEKDYVSICGCNLGIDWNVTHKDKMVELRVHKSKKVVVSKELYINKVREFIKGVEQFYCKPEDKEVPNEDFEQKGFRQFWNEWNDLKLKNNI